jgi:mono/diheme cytochrome c family protein
MRRLKFGALAIMLTLVACADAGQNDAGTQTDTASGAAATPPAASEPAGGATTGNLPPGTTQQDVTAGQQIFTSTGNCFTCHGADARGTQLAPTLTDSEWINTDGTLNGIVNVVNTGVAQPKQFPAPMPPNGGAQLSAAQVRQVATYVWSLGGGK